MSDTTLINDVSINGNEGLNTASELSETLQENTVNAIGVDASSRTIWVNGQPYGNAYVNVNDDNTIDAPLGAEIFNDFEHNIAAGEYSGAHGKCTQTTNEAESAFGKYNKSTEGSTIFSIGDGYSTDDRHNIVEVSRNGVNINNALNIEDNLDVTGATTLNGAVTLGDAEGDPITVNGDTNFKADVDITKTLNVDSNTTIGGTLVVDSNTTIGGTLGVTGAAHFETKPTVTNGTIVEDPVALVSELESTKNSLENQISNEASAREQADINLGTRIDNEASAREQADTNLGTRIDNEASAREQADTNLGTRIDNEVSALDDKIVIVPGDADGSGVMKGAGNSATGKNSLAIGQNNKTISENSVAMGNSNIAGLKGWYYKAIQISSDSNVVYLYLTTEQQIPIVVTSASAVENQEKNINFNISKGDICSISNGNRLIDCFEVRLNEMSKYGRISLTYKGEGTNPLSTIQNVEELKLEDYSVFCISKPSYGIVELSKCNIALGNNTKSLAESSVSIGLRSTAAGITTYAEGQDTIAVGECAHAEGAFTKANGIASHTEGVGTQTEGLSAHAEGYNTLATGGASHSEGSATKATGLHSHAEGDTTLASGSQSHAEGKITSATGENSHAEGHWTKASGKSSHAEGQGISEDNPNLAEGDYSHTEGYSTRAPGTGSHAEGTYTIAEGHKSHAEGNATTATGENSHTEGHWTKAYGKSSHAEGQGISADNPNLAEGDYSHTEGYSTHAQGNGSHAEGTYTIASGNRSHAEGNETKAIGSASHAEGYLTSAYGSNSYAGGRETLAFAECSHAEGKGTCTGSYTIDDNGNYVFTETIGSYAHAEGENTIAEGKRSHAEGNTTKALGESSHAEGYNTKAQGVSSHAEGKTTTATGDYSHTSGLGTQTENNAEFACGKYNKSTKNVTLHSVGIGTSDNDRKNAHEITTDGKHYILGVGNYDGTNPDTSYDLATYLPKMVNITYKKLDTLRNTGQLIPGQQYRIIDYETIIRENTSIITEGHQFDIIVTADDESTLNEVARACLHDVDTYFTEAGANLSAWKIWYCLDNDPDKFDWADTENGKGVIYRMIDEWNNDCPYDFKNIKFKNANDSADTNYYYTFSLVLSGSVNDYSLDLNNCYANKISPYIYLCQYQLNNIVFINTDNRNTCCQNSFGNACRKMSFRDDCCYNTFSDNCFENTFGSNCSRNKFGVSCFENTFGSTCQENIFGNDCSKFDFGSNCSKNIFGNGCMLIKFGNFCAENSFGNECEQITLDGNSLGNIFGNTCYVNSFGKFIQYNSFGNNCHHNYFGDDCKYNSFGNGCHYNSFRLETLEADVNHDSPLKSFCYYNHFDDGCSYNLIWANSANGLLQNVNLNRGTYGSKSSGGAVIYNKIYIDVNRNYETQVSKTQEGGVVKYYFNSTGFTKI